LALTRQAFMEALRPDRKARAHRIGAMIQAASAKASASATGIKTGTWSVTSALGLPDAGCEFGPCGGVLDAGPGGSGSSSYGSLPGYNQQVIWQIGLQTGQLTSLIDEATSATAKWAGCEAVGFGAGFKSFFGLPNQMMAGPYPGPSSILRGVRRGLNVQDAEAAAATAAILAARVGTPILARTVERGIPIVGAAAALFQLKLAGDDADSAYSQCFGAH
jgi:hypothetical protein